MAWPRAGSLPIAFLIVPAWQACGGGGGGGGTSLCFRFTVASYGSRALLCAHVRVIRASSFAPRLLQSFAVVPVRGSVVFSVVYSSLYILFTDCTINVCRKYLLSL